MDKRAARSEKRKGCAECDSASPPLGSKYLLPSLVSPTWRAARTGGEAPGDWWRSSSAVRGRSSKSKSRNRRMLQPTSLCTVHAMVLARAISNEWLSREILKAVAQFLKDRFVKTLPRGHGATRFRDNTSASLKDRLLTSSFSTESQLLPQISGEGHVGGACLRPQSPGCRED